MSSEITYEQQLASTSHALKKFQGPVFRTHAKDLWATFLHNIPLAVRQHYTCRACQHFIERYGNLATIVGAGHVQSLIWTHVDACTDLYRATSALQACVRRASIVGVFKTSESYLGHQSLATSPWHHFGGPTPARAYSNAPDADMGNMSQNYAQVMTFLVGYPIEAFTNVVTLLKSGQLVGAEKCVGQAEWLLKMKRLQVSKSPSVHNLFWWGVASAPDGFCHPSTSMISTLFKTLGQPFDNIAGAFAAKMSGDVYRRPTADIKRGAVDAAEKVFRERGLEKSLKRQYATLADLTCAWTPDTNSEPKVTRIVSEIFGDLTLKKPRLPDIMRLPDTMMTAVKFIRDIVPRASNMLYWPSVGPDTYFAFTRPVDASSPPLIKWPRQVSAYSHSGGALAHNFALPWAEKAKVLAVCRHPSTWGEVESLQDNMTTYFVLAGCRDITNTLGLGLFPEILRSDLKSLERVIEAHSNRGRLLAVGVPACGVVASSRSVPRGTFDVTIGATVQKITLDRWE